MVHMAYYWPEAAPWQGRITATVLAPPVRYTMYTMSERVICELCGAALPTLDSYIVRIDVFAEPSIPAVSTEDLEESAPGEKIADLIEQMKHLSAEDAQDQVHRRFEYRLCAPCQRRFLANPLGKPRQTREGRN
jgi:hypothetical protein